MIIQNEDKDPIEPNDSPFGGCLVYTFSQSVSLVNFGILDIDEGSNAEITVTDSNGLALPTFESPRVIGNNVSSWNLGISLDFSYFPNVLFSLMHTFRLRCCCCRVSGRPTQLKTWLISTT